jgi:hypothetical protein
VVVGVAAALAVSQRILAEADRPIDHDVKSL